MTFAPASAIITDVAGQTTANQTNKTEYGGIAQLGAGSNGYIPLGFFTFQIVVQVSNTLYNRIRNTQSTLTWGYSSAGRALEWHSRGQRFDPAYLHQNQVLWVFLDIRLALSQGGSFCLRCDRFKIQAPAELLKVDGELDVQLVAAVNVYPAD